MGQIVLDGLMFEEKEDMHKACELLQGMNFAVRYASFYEEACMNVVLSELDNLNLEYFSDEETDRMAERIGLLLSRDPKLKESFARHARRVILNDLLDFDRQLVEKAVVKLGYEYEDEFDDEDEDEFEESYIADL